MPWTIFEKFKIRWCKISTKLIFSLCARTIHNLCMRFMIGNLVHPQYYAINEFILLKVGLRLILMGDFFFSCCCTSIVQWSILFVKETRCLHFLICCKSRNSCFDHSKWCRPWFSITIIEGDSKIVIFYFMERISSY